jgi:serine/threonine protein phosphatase PrpC
LCFPKGLRDEQEDRVLVIPELFDTQLTFAGVFDGTSGHHASQFASRHFGEYLCRTSEMKEVLQISKQKNISSKSSFKSVETVAKLFDRGITKAFKGLDNDFIDICEEKSKEGSHEMDYVASTAVTVLLWRNLLTVSHLGDSRACIFKKCGGKYVAEWLTIDHKPNNAEEFKRIKHQGGILSWRGSKPYMRAGDYAIRASQGERPKQLNYSRALGAKNLKPFGLSNEPTINHFELSSEDKLIVLASDGLWDVLEPLRVLSIALDAIEMKKSISDEIVAQAIEEMPKARVADNISVIAIQLNMSLD